MDTCNVQASAPGPGARARAPWRVGVRGRVHLQVVYVSEKVTIAPRHDFVYHTWYNVVVVVVPYKFADRASVHALLRGWIKLR